MTKIEELILDNSNDINDPNQWVEKIMKEYAEFYARKYVESRRLQTGHIDVLFGDKPDIIVDETYFRYIYTLPEHE